MHQGEVKFTSQTELAKLLTNNKYIIYARLLYLHGVKRPPAISAYQYPLLTHLLLNFPLNLIYFMICFFGGQYYCYQFLFFASALLNYNFSTCAIKRAILCIHLCLSYQLLCFDERKGAKVLFISNDFKRKQKFSLTHINIKVINYQLYGCLIALRTPNFG